MSNRRGMKWLAVPLIAIIVGCRGSSADFQVSPMSFSDCNGPNTAVDVSWEIPDSPQARVNIYVKKIGRPPVLWHSGLAKGHKLSLIHI